VTFSPDFIAKT
jgi:hypothetical protein